MHKTDDCDRDDPVLTDRKLSPKSVFPAPESIKSKTESTVQPVQSSPTCPFFLSIFQSLIMTCYRLYSNQDCKKKPNYYTWQPGDRMSNLQFSTRLGKPYAL